jgi:predicted glycoside hydrolase/deacetylase ChbG (UPF0249 family)
MKTLGLSLLPAFLLFSSSPAKAETLGEKLGYGREDKLLILHIDDIGSIGAANEAARENFAYGLALSGSVMAPGPAFDKVKGALAGLEPDLGVHVTLNSDGRPAHQWKPSHPAVPSLLDEAGNLRASPLKTLAFGRNEEVVAEMDAQIREGFALGFGLSHVDTHLGAAFFKPSWIEAYCNLARKYRLAPMVPRWSAGIQRLLGPAAWPMGYVLRPLLTKIEAAGFLLLDDYYLLPFPKADPGPGARKAEYLQILKNLKPGVTEIAFHPALADEEFERDILKGSPGERVRTYEASFLNDPEVRAVIEAEGVKLIDWRQVQGAYDWSKVNELTLFP